MGGRRLALGAALSLAAAVAPAYGGFSEPQANASGEPNQRQILQHTYGGTFQREGNDFTNGTITATRVDDGQDMTWAQTDAIVSARAVAAFHALGETFGYFNGATGGAFTPLFTLSGHGYDVSGQAGEVPMHDDYRLGRGGDGFLYSSNQGDNVDGRDHMITYAITGLAGVPSNVQTWMLFWEDTPAPSSDFDYNDLVVELKTDPPVGSNPPPLLIPLPPAAWSGLSGLACLGAVGGLRRLRRANPWPR